MSASKLAIISLAIAYAEARFGQEGLVQAEISALGDLGEAGAAATLAGQTPGVLLAGAGPCDKLSLADEIVSQLGDSAEVLSAAAALVAAERNFNPFAVDTGDICADPSLPATEALRGIVPLFDPDVEGADVQNANAEASLQSPFDADGLSVAEVALAQGFTNFRAVDADGAEVALAGLGAGGGASAGNGNAGNGNAGNAGGATGGGAADDDDAAADEDEAVDEVEDENEEECDADADDDEDEDVEDDANQNNGNQGNQGNGNQNNGNQGNGNQNNGNQGNGNQNNGNQGNGNQNNGNQGNGNQDNAGDDDAAAGGAGGAADFGDCDPTMVFEGGLNGRPADEFTFQSADAAIAANQQEALNPNIITNRICDELVNICGANDAAIQACEDAQQAVIDAGLGPGSDGDEVLSTFNDLVLAA